MILDLYSKRQKALNAPGDVFVYDSIPAKLRTQLCLIIRDLYRIDTEWLGDITRLNSIVHGLMHEYGMVALGRSLAKVDQLFEFLGSCRVDEFLDIVELVSRDLLALNPSKSAYFGDLINARFLESGIGYSCQNGTIIRVDSQLLHSKVVIPLLRQLSDPPFQPCLEEFASAHAHYREGRFKECLNDCLKAFESCLKITAGQKGWSYAQNDTAKPLINILLTHGLMAPYHESQLHALRQLLESGIPTLRNKNAGHGQGEKAIVVDQNLAEYSIHITASTLLFIRGLA